MAGVVHIPWYATAIRHNKLAEALAEIAPVAMRYGASAYAVHRSRDDRYKFLQTATFESKQDWERYWSGQEFIDWRVVWGGHWQVPTLYVWNDIVVEGHIEPEAPVAPAPADAPAPEPEPQASV